jgi:electron transfer flavoprotein alpha subunit
MMNTLILVEHDNQSLHPVTLNTLSAAKHFAGPVHMLVVGHQCQSVVDQCAKVDGVSLVLVVDNPVYEHVLAEQLTPLVVELASAYQAILAPATTFGKNSLPRVAAKLDVAQISDVTTIIDENTFEHPIYAGNAIQRVQSLDSIKLLTIRTTAFDPVMGTQPPCPTKTIDVEPISVKTQFVSHQLNQSTRPELGSAKIIVSGGRGLQSAEKFKLIDELADVLGGAVGASRAAVDAGFVPNDYQVGQTGKVVAPDLYIAIGISGAIQHLAGMKDSKVIVAINKDEDAPIFQIANYGLVGDLFEVVPELIRILKS